MINYNRKMKQRAQEMRKNATQQENKLWYDFLRGYEYHFTRQKPIDNYIVDFYCHSKKLIIEIDGNQHYTQDGLEYDYVRTKVMESLGLHVMRFTNKEIDTEFHKVCKTIQEHIDLLSR